MLEHELLQAQLDIADETIRVAQEVCDIQEGIIENLQKVVANQREIIGILKAKLAICERGKHVGFSSN